VSKWVNGGGWGAKKAGLKRGEAPRPGAAGGGGGGGAGGGGGESLGDPLNLALG